MSAVKPKAFGGHGFSLRGEKGRITLPPAFRKAITGPDEDRVLCLTKHEKWNCLSGFGAALVDTFEDQLDQEEERAVRRNQEFDRDMRSMQLYNFSEMPFDASGRFILQDYLADLAGLGESIFFQGVGRSFLLWNPQTLYRLGDGWEVAQAICRQMESEALAKAKRK